METRRWRFYEQYIFKAELLGTELVEEAQGRFFKSFLEKFWTPEKDCPTQATIKYVKHILYILNRK